MAIEYIFNNKIQYKEKFSQNPIKDYVSICSRIYKQRKEKELKNNEGIVKAPEPALKVIDELIPEPSQLPKDLEGKIEEILRPELEFEESKLEEIPQDQSIQNNNNVSSNLKNVESLDKIEENKSYSSVNKSDESIVFIRKSNLDDSKPLFIPKTKKKNARMSAQRTESRNYEAPTASSNRKAPTVSSNRKTPTFVKTKALNINKSHDVHEEYL